MHYSISLKAFILSICFTAVLGTLLIQASPGLACSPADPEAPSAQASPSLTEKPFDPDDERRAFVGNMAVSTFLILCLLYAGHILFATKRIITPASARRPDGTEGRISIAQAMRYFDGGSSNFWAFLILTLFLPIFLSSLSDVVPALDPDLNKIDKAYHELFISSLGTQIVYFISVVTISVLITLEFSYIHTLRRSVPDWIPMLLVALAMDFVTLLVFNFIVRHPNHWAVEPSTFTRLAMILAAIMAFVSSCLILISARTAAALNDGQVDFPAFNANDIDHLKEKKIGGAGDGQT